MRSETALTPPPTGDNKKRGSRKEVNPKFDERLFRFAPQLKHEFRAENKRNQEVHVPDLQTSNKCDSYWWRNRNNEDAIYRFPRPVIEKMQEIDDTDNW